MKNRTKNLSCDIITAIKTANIWAFPTILASDIVANEKEKNKILHQVVEYATSCIDNENSIEMTTIISMAIHSGYDTNLILDQLQDEYDMAYENSLTGDEESISQFHFNARFTAIKTQDKINLIIKASTLAIETKQTK